MPTKVQKWGNSLAVRLPKAMVRRLALKEGSDVVVREDQDAIIIRKQALQGRPIGKNDWKRYLLPAVPAHKREAISNGIDAIAYGTPR